MPHLLRIPVVQLPIVFISSFVYGTVLRPRGQMCSLGNLKFYLFWQRERWTLHGKRCIDRVPLLQPSFADPPRRLPAFAVSMRSTYISTMDTHKPVGIE